MEKKDPTRKVYIKDTPFEVPYCTEQKKCGQQCMGRAGCDSCAG